MISLSYFPLDFDDLQTAYSWLILFDKFRYLEFCCRWMLATLIDFYINVVALGV